MTTTTFTSRFARVSVQEGGLLAALLPRIGFTKREPAVRIPSQPPASVVSGAIAKLSDEVKRLELPSERSRASLAKPRFEVTEHQDGKITVTFTSSRHSMGTTIAEVERRLRVAGLCEPHGNGAAGMLANY